MKNETTIYLNIYNFHNDINNILNIKPSVVHIKGELITKKGKIRYKQNIWTYKLSENNIIHIESLLSKLVNIFKVSKNELKSISKEHDIQISIVSYIREGMPSFCFLKEFIEFVHDIGATVDIDLYCLDDN